MRGGVRSGVHEQEVCDCQPLFVLAASLGDSLPVITSPAFSPHVDAHASSVLRFIVGVSTALPRKRLS